MNIKLQNVNKEFLNKVLIDQMMNLEKEGFLVVYICVYGSQNYDLDVYTEDYCSDIDLKAVILPKLDDLVNNSKPVSKIYKYEFGEIDIKDIRLYIDNIIKVNPSYIETLYTDYYCINADFYREIYSILNLRDELVFNLRHQFIKAIYGMMQEKKHAMCHPYPSVVDKIEKFGFDGKQTSHCIRLYYLMKRYFENREPLYSCLHPNLYEKDIILKHKLNKISLNEANIELDFFMNNALKFKDDILSNIDDGDIDYSVKNKLIKLSRDIIKSNIINEVKYGEQDI